jgi:hypothetical protein
MSITQLDDYRPVPPPLGSVHDWRLVDRFCRDLLLSEGVEAQIRCELAGILLEALGGNTVAIAAWKAIEATIRLPLRQQVSGEQMFEPLLARLRDVHDHATGFWNQRASGERPRYIPSKEEWQSVEH